MQYEELPTLGVEHFALWQDLRFGDTHSLPQLLGLVDCPSCEISCDGVYGGGVCASCASTWSVLSACACDSYVHPKTPSSS